MESTKINNATYKLKVSFEYALGGYENTNSAKAANRYLYELIHVKFADSKEESNVSRCDIAFDILWDYKPNSKLYTFAFALITDKLNDKFKMMIVNGENLGISNLINGSGHWTVSIYDKKLESNGKHQYHTRIEFRYRDYCNEDIIKTVKQFIKVIHSACDNNESLTQRRVNQLYEQYQNELSEGTVKSFSAFVKKMDMFFYSRDILEQVYNKTGLKASFVHWLKDHKARNKNFKIYTLPQVKRFIADLEKSAKKYIKS